MGRAPMRVVLRGAATGSYLIEDDAPLVFGRQAEIPILDLAASRSHCRIELAEGGLELVDLASLNGTLLNGSPVRRARLRSGDEIRIGSSVIEVRIEDEEEPPPSFDGCYICAGCGRDISLETFAEGEVIEIEGRFTCPECAQGGGEPIEERVARIAALLAPHGFRDLTCLGVTGSALVVGGVREPLGQPLALKVVESGRAPREAVERLLREARLAAPLQHPGVVHLIDVFVTDALVALVLERIEGRTLFDEIAETGKLAPQRALLHGAAVARALGYLHSQGIAHLDVKPANVIVLSAGGVKLIDFGLARRLADPHEGPRAEGTPAYAAPEQLHAPSAVDGRADIFGLGATLHHALLGRPPVRDAMGRTIPLGHHAEAGTALPPHVVELVDRCLAHDPRRRFPDMGALERAIDAALRLELGLDSGATAAVAALGARKVGHAETQRLTRARLDSSLSESQHGMTGRFRGTELIEVVQLVELHQKTGRLEVRTPDGTEGVIALREGKAVRARFGGAKGAEAILAALALPEGTFRLLAEVGPEPAEEAIPFGPLLLEVMRRRDEAER